MVCDVDEDLVKKVKQFRLRKETNNAAIISEYSLPFVYFVFHLLLCDVCSKVFVSSLALEPVFSDRCCGNMLSKTDLRNERKKRKSNMILDGKSGTVDLVDKYSRWCGC